MSKSVKSTVLGYMERVMPSPLVARLSDSLSKRRDDKKMVKVVV